MVRLRRLRGVLAGAVLSGAGIAVCLGLTWLRRNHLAGGNADAPAMAIAIVAAVSATVLAATALLLLRKNSPDVRITNVLTAGAVSVSFVPLEMVLLKETWAVFASSALAPIPVLLALSRLPLGSLSIADSLEFAGRDPAGEAGTTREAPLWYEGYDGDGGASWTSDYEVAALRRRRGRNGARALARGTVVDMNRGGGDGEEQRRMPHFRRDARCIWDSKHYAAKRRVSRQRPDARPVAWHLAGQAANAREDLDALSEHVAALSEELESSIERLDRICDDIDVRRESETHAPAQQEPGWVAAGDVSGLSESLSGAVGRLNALCERLEPCVDHIERLAASFEERTEKAPPSPDGEAIASTGRATDQSPPFTPGSDELGVLREDALALVSRLRHRVAGNQASVLEVQVIRGLQERLDGLLQKLRAEENE